MRRVLPLAMSSIDPHFPAVSIKEHMTHVARGRGDLVDYRDSIIWLLCHDVSASTVIDTPASRTRVSHGRALSRHVDDALHLALGQPVLQDWGQDAAERDIPDSQITAETRRSSYNTEQAVQHGLISVERDPPAWCDAQRIAAPLSRVLDAATSGDTEWTIEHATDLAAVASVRMMDEHGIGHYRCESLGRTGRIQLDERYDDVPVISVVVPAESLMLSPDTIRRLGTQVEYRPSSRYDELPEPQPP